MQPPLRTAVVLTILIIGLLCLSGCANVGQHGPYNTSSDGADSRLMLNGFDPVAYHTQAQHVLGKTDLKAEYDTVVYRFANESNRATFLKNPTQFIPQFGGFCANGIAYGIPWGGDGDSWKVANGKLYIFGGQSSKKYYVMDEAANTRLADQYWQAEVKGSGALVQRYKRLILRVPHYKSGADLEKQYQQWQKQNPPASVKPS